jgi:Zn finger protein HypA/HybF involved in hydrogenase expression
MKTKKNKAEVQTKPEPKKEPASYSRIMSIADAMKAGATDVEKILADADKLYVKRTSRASNPKETRTNFSFVRSTLLAFGFATEANGKLTLKG